MAQLTGQPQSVTDGHYMALALEAARAGLGWSAPNPMVGCVLVQGSQVVGVGAHLRDGAEHAETRALAAAGDARGATAYITLEPCTHVGRQPACSKALIAAGIKRVVYGSQDADPRTAGMAKAVFEAAGVSVTAGVMAAECDRFLDYYLHAAREKKVFVHLKMALSLDAKLACKTGHSKWLSCPVALGYAHYLRQKYDAVLVGSGTVRADNPHLTARTETMEPYFRLPVETPARNPVRVILDSTFSLTANQGWNFLDTSGDNFRQHLPRVVLTGCNKDLPPLHGTGGESTVAHLGLAENENGMPDLGDLLEKLWQVGIRSLLVEGGSQVAGEFLRQGKADKLSLVFTPRILGSDALGFSPELGLRTVGEGIDLAHMEFEQLGTDVLISGYFRNSEEESGKI